MKRRIFVEEIPLVGTVRIAVMSGKQRDQYVTEVLRIRADLAKHPRLEELPKLPEAEATKLMQEVMSADPAFATRFNVNQYLLISWCVCDENDAPVFKDAEAAAAELDYEQSDALAKACERINKLTTTAKKDEQMDFFDVQKGGNGSVSLAPSENQT